MPASQNVPDQDSSRLLAPPDAMAIVEMERQQLHEKIARPATGISTRSTNGAGAAIRSCS